MIHFALVQLFPSVLHPVLFTLASFCYSITHYALYYGCNIQNKVKIPLLSY